MPVPLRRELARHEGVRDRRRRAPLHLVDEILGFRRLHQRRCRGRVVVEDHAAAAAGRLHHLQDCRVGVRHRQVQRHALDRDARLLGDLDGRTVGVRRDRVRRGDDERLHACADESLGCALHAVARSHVRLDEDGRAEALGLDAGADHDEALGLVVPPVDSALGEARVADDADDLVALDQLPCERRLLRRVERVRVERVVDRVALDAAVVVDALEVGGDDLADRREVDAGDHHVEAAHLDRRCPLPSCRCPCRRRSSLRMPCPSRPALLRVRAPVANAVSISARRPPTAHATPILILVDLIRSFLRFSRTVDF